MKTVLSGGALALLLCSAPAVAQDNSSADIVALGQRPDAHGPAGTMGDHVHKAGDLMVGVSWMHEAANGVNRSGSVDISDSSVVAAGFTSRTESMVMDMAMLHVMWAPSDKVTLMLVPSWQRMRMTMLVLTPTTDHDGEPLLPGDRMSQTVSGVGDTQLGALVSLRDRLHFSAHAGLALSIPTGSVSRKDEHGNFVHYGLQPGSGTWDLIPSLTLRGGGRALGWGAQVSYLWRTGGHNRSGFAFGDRFTATAWVSKPLSRRASLSARLGWTSEGPVLGHYNSGHSHAAPPDRQANYGGERLDAGLGANLVLGTRMRLGIEAGVPLYQSVNGIQAPRKFTTSLSLTRAF